MSAVPDLLLLFGDATPGPTRAEDQVWRRSALGPGPWALYTTRGAADTDAAPLLVEVAHGAWRAWLVGEVYRYAGVGAERGDPFARFVEDVAAGRARPEELCGRFVIAAWDTARAEWHVWTDRLGTLHAYWCEGARAVALGTFSPAVAAPSERRLDWVALTGFFTFGFFPSDRTHFDDVRLLGPATHAVFAADGRLLRRDAYRRWHHAPDLRRSPADTLAELDAVWRAVVADHLRGGPVAIPISGGLDSRTIVAAATDARAAAPWTFSYGYSDQTREVAIAAQVARARALPFTAYSIGPYLFDRLPAITAALEGFSDVTQCRQAAISEQLASHARRVLGGHLGDLWFSDMRVGEGGGAGTDLADLACARLRKPGGDWLVRHLCAPHIDPAAAQAEVEQLFRDDLTRLEAIADPDFRLKALKVDQYVFRWTGAGIRMYEAAAFVRLPFYDARVVEFFSTVPTALLRGRRLQVDYLRRFAPDLARVRWQAYDANLYWYRYADTLLLPRRAAKKLWRLLRHTPTIQRNWEIQLLGATGADRLWQTLQHRDAPLADFVAPETVDALLATLAARPSRDVAYSVTALLTFAAWLERFGRAGAASAVGVGDAGFLAERRA